MNLIKLASILLAMFALVSASHGANYSLYWGRVCRPVARNYRGSMVVVGMSCRRVLMRHQQPLYMTNAPGTNPHFGGALSITSVMPSTLAATTTTTTTTAATTTTSTMSSTRTEAESWVTTSAPTATESSSQAPQVETTLTPKRLDEQPTSNATSVAPFYSDSSATSAEPSEGKLLDSATSAAAATTAAVSSTPEASSLSPSTEAVTEPAPTQTATDTSANTSAPDTIVEAKPDRAQSEGEPAGSTSQPPASELNEVPSSLRVSSDAQPLTADQPLNFIENLEPN